MPGTSVLPHVDFLEQLPYGMATSEFQDDKPQVTSTYQTSAWVMFARSPLAKASHKHGWPQYHVGGDLDPTDPSHTW